VAAATALGLAEFGQHAVGRFGVEEGNELATGAFDRLFVDELGTSAFGLGELSFDAVGAKSDVVDAFAILGEKLCDGAVISGRFEKFDVHFAHYKEGGADFLGGHFLTVLALETENGLVVFDGFVEGTNGNAEVVDFLNHRRLSFLSVKSSPGGEASLINLIALKYGY
jgi:hypothetical protein